MSDPQTQAEVQPETPVPEVDPTNVEQPVTEPQEAQLQAEDPNAAAPSAEQPSTEDTSSSALSVSELAGTLPIGANSEADGMSFEQRVEARFLAVEHALINLPHSIKHVMEQGSTDADTFAKKVLTHLFSKNQTTE